MFFTIDKSEFTPSGKIINLFFPALGTSVLVLSEKKRSKPHLSCLVVSIEYGLI